MIRMLLRSLPKATLPIVTRTGVLSLADIAHPTPFRSGRVQHAQASPGRGAEVSIAEMQAVVPPRVSKFQDNCVNTVTLSGVVADDPVEKIYAGDKKLVELHLAVPKYPKRTESADFDYYRLTFFEFSGQQAKQHLTNGKKAIIQGHLRTFRGVPSVYVDDFSWLDDKTWPYTTEVPQYNAEVQQQYPRMQADGDRTVVRPFLGNYVATVHDAWRDGKTVEEIAKMRNIQVSTVLSYLAECAFHGKQMDFEQLARSCLLGPTGSKFMEIDTVYAAIKTVIDGQKIDDLTKVPARDVHAFLRGHNGGTLFKVQEDVIRSVTYSQMATVLAMMKRGMQPRDWNSFRVADLSADHETAARKQTAPY